MGIAGSVLLVEMFVVGVFPADALLVEIFVVGVLLAVVLVVGVLLVEVLLVEVLLVVVLSTAVLSTAVLSTALPSLSPERSELLEHARNEPGHSYVCGYRGRAFFLQKSQQKIPPNEVTTFQSYVLGSCQQFQRLRKSERSGTSLGICPVQ